MYDCNKLFYPKQSKYLLYLITVKILFNLTEHCNFGTCVRMNRKILNHIYMNKIEILLLLKM